MSQRLFPPELHPYWAQAIKETGLHTMRKDHISYCIGPAADLTENSLTQSPSLKTSFAYTAWQLQQVSEEGGGTFTDEICKPGGKAVFPLTCLSIAGRGCLPYMATPQPSPSSLHVVQRGCITAVFGGKWRGSLCPVLPEDSPGSLFQTEVGIFPEAMSAGCLALAGIWLLHKKSLSLALEKALSPLKKLFFSYGGTRSWGSLLLNPCICWNNNAVCFMLQRSTGLPKGFMMSQC